LCPAQHQPYRTPSRVPLRDDITALAELIPQDQFRPRLDQDDDVDAYQSRDLAKPQHNPSELDLDPVRQEPSLERPYPIIFGSFKDTDEPQDSEPEGRFDVYEDPINARSYGVGSGRIGIGSGRIGIGSAGSDGDLGAPLPSLRQGRRVEKRVFTLLRRIPSYEKKALSLLLRHSSLKQRPRTSQQVRKLRFGRR